MRRLVIVGVAVSAMFATSFAAPASAFGPTAAKKYANCKALNKAFPHGVAKSKSVKDRNKKGQVVADPVKNFKVNAASYSVNKGLDRDKDGIACEKH